MIDDLSKTLRSILDDRAIEKTCKELFDADVLFDRPNDQFKPVQPAVNLFLYDVRENRDIRSNEPLREHSEGRTIFRRPPLRVSCSYLVTAWASGDGEEPLLKEQRLLSQTLQVLSSYPIIPAKFFPSKSALEAQEPPLPMMITQMDGVKDPADFWSAIGGKLRPAFAVTVTLSLPIFEPLEPEGAPLVTTRRIDIGERTSGGGKGISPETLSSTRIGDLFRVTGSVADQKGAPVKDAVVRISELGVRATTDQDGRYNLGLIPKGRHTLHVAPGWKGSELKSKEVIIDVSASVEVEEIRLDK
jgi:hypothetical protein